METPVIYSAGIETPIGSMVAGVTSNALCLLEFADPQRLEAQQRNLRQWFASAVVPEKQPLHDSVQEELAEYFSGQRKMFSLPLVYPGTIFQRRVWDALRRIPYGAVYTYEEIAHQLGADKAVRAVGAANGRNRLAIVIPCHRVVRKDGGLGGYGGELWRKQWLLALEQRHAQP